MNRFEEEMSGFRGDMSRFDARMTGVEARMVTRDDLKRLADRTGALEVKISGLATKAELKEGLAPISGITEGRGGSLR